MGATPSHEDDGDDGDEVEDSDDDDEVIRMQRRYRVSVEAYRINCMNYDFFPFAEEWFYHKALLIGFIYHWVTFMELCFQNQFLMKKSSVVSEF